MNLLHEHCVLRPTCHPIEFPCVRPGAFVPKVLPFDARKRTPSKVHAVSRIRVNETKRKKPNGFQWTAHGHRRNIVATRTRSDAFSLGATFAVPCAENCFRPADIHKCTPTNRSRLEGRLARLEGAALLNGPYHHPTRVVCRAPSC